MQLYSGAMEPELPVPDPLARLRAVLADRYTIGRELGQGGMGIVLLAQDQKHHRQVAIKVLKPELAAAVGRERFLREMERLVAAHLRLTARGPSLVELGLAGARRALARMSSELSAAWGALKEEVEVGP